MTSVTRVIISKSLGLRSGKTDKADSKDLCRYAFEKRDSIRPSVLPSELIVKLKKLLSRRDLPVKHKKSLTISFAEQKKTLHPELLPLFESQTKASVQLDQDQIEQLEGEIEKTIHQDPDMKGNYDLVHPWLVLAPSRRHIYWPTPKTSPNFPVQGDLPPTPVQPPFCNINQESKRAITGSAIWPTRSSKVC